MNFESMSNDDPPDSFFLDWRPHPGPRFEALIPALLAIEDAISHQSDQLTLRTQADLKRKGASAAETSDELAVLHHETEELLARVFRSGFLVSVWSLFESSIKELGEYVRAKRNLAFGLDRGGGDFLTQTDRFFRAALNILPFPNDEERRQLDLFRRFRNALVHHDGSIADVPKELIAESGFVHGFCLVGHSHEFAVPSARYARSSLELFGRVSQSLADNVFALLPSENGAA